MIINIIMTIFYNGRKYIHYTFYISPQRIPLRNSFLDFDSVLDLRYIE